MSDHIKTITFVSVAILCVIGAFFNMPTLGELKEGDPTGQPLFPKFTDPLAATSLSITKYNEQTGDIIPFEVAQVDGIWCIPSHEDYPADAAEHLGQAATALSGLKILGLASDEPGSQETYGVVDPTDKNLRPGMTGIGMRVVLKDAQDKKLVDVIIGKQDPKQPDVRYVRRTGQEMIFSVRAQTDQLTTKFDDWIEKDLLKMNVLDIRDVFIEDYSIDEMRGELIQQGKLVVHYDPTAEGDKWSLLEDLAFDQNKSRWVPTKLQDHEMLDNERLDKMKSALEDLKIVDVLRKPAGLSADLAADKSLLDNETAKNSLAVHGFYMANIDGQPGIYSNEGEIGVLLSDGVEYVLRFGSIAVNSKAAASSESDKEGKPEDKDTDASGVNRYLLVTTRFNSTAIPQPDFQELPPLPEEAKEAAPDQPEGQPTEVPALTEEAKAKIEQIKAERERIERENQIKKDEYDEKVAAGQKRVEELNTRFADWYYVISENVFKKLRLARKELIKVKQPEPTEMQTPPSDSATDALSPLSPGMLEKLKEGIGKP